MISEANKFGLQLVCTEKDYVKINKKLRGKYILLKWKLNFR